jgi:hypothetical protein
LAVAAAMFWWRSSGLAARGPLFSSLGGDMVTALDQQVGQLAALG